MDRHIAGVAAGVPTDQNAFIAEFFEVRRAGDAIVDLQQMRDVGLRGPIQRHRSIRRGHVATRAVADVQHDGRGAARAGVDGQIAKTGRAHVVVAEACVVAEGDVRIKARVGRLQVQKAAQEVDRVRRVGEHTSSGVEVQPHFARVQRQRPREGVGTPETQNPRAEFGHAVAAREHAVERHHTIAAASRRGVNQALLRAKRKIRRVRHRVIRRVREEKARALADTGRRAERHHRRREHLRGRRGAKTQRLHALHRRQRRRSAINVHDGGR